MPAALEAAIVTVIVAGAVAFSAWRFMPARTRLVLGSRLERALASFGMKRAAPRAAPTAASGTRVSTPGCDNCPQGRS